MVPTERAIRTIFTTCLAVKPHEKILMVTDNDLEKIARHFQKIGQEYASVTLLNMPIPPYNAIEPPPEIAKAMLQFPVQLLITSCSLSHTNARRQATAHGARIASMPRITEDILQRAIVVDYPLMKQRTNHLADLLDQGSTVHITTQKGTDLTLSIAGRKAHGRKSGIFDKPEYWGNLPEGEAFIAPLEERADGIVYIDGSIAGVGPVDNVKLVLRKGKLVRVSHPVFEQMLTVAGEKARTIAEFGIGTNDKAQLSGVVLEDEKVLGTAHIAFGNNLGFDGTNDVQFHVDCVFTKPTIYINDKKIMECGKLVVPFTTIANPLDL